MNALRFTLLDGTFAVCRLPADAPVPAWADGGPLGGALRAAGELTVVTPTEAVPAGVEAGGAWRALVLEGPFSFEAVGVLAGFAAPLAAAGVPIMAYATFSTDVVLVPAPRLRRALAALARAGFERAVPDATVRYGLGPSPLGRMLVATTARGLCAVAFGADDDALEADLAASLRALRPAQPAAPPVRADDALEPVRRVVLRVLDGDAAALPLDEGGTPFQRRAWAAMRAIPHGRTRTYAALAAELGLAPGGARVVAQAVAANPVALVTPCHRVVRTDGRPTDFRWGAARKAWLLAHERGGQLTLF